MNSLSVAVGMASVVSIAAACSSSTEDTTPTTTPSTCSDGTPYAAGTVFPSYDGGAVQTACVRHCGAVESGALGPTTAALPSGACASTDADCQMLAEQVPACPAGAKASGPLSGFVCQCQSGQWHCGISSQGGNVQSCGDAGVGP